MNKTTSEVADGRSSTIDGGVASSCRPLGPHAALVVYERDGARVIDVRPGPAVVLGRQGPAEIILSDPSVSRRHARLEWRGEELFVEDLGSRNGTAVGEDSAPSMRLRSGDIVRFGRVLASVHLVSDGAPGIGGIDTYDALLAALESELTRARHFRRGLAVLAVRAERSDANAHVSRWCPGIRAELADVDRFATFGVEAAVILVPEADADRAREVAERVVAPRAGEPRLYCGVAVYPSSASSAERIVEVAREACRRATASTNVCFTSERDANPRDTGELVAESPVMRDLRETVRRVARSPVPVLILGETGTGKELMARSLHELGTRPSGPLRIVNCAAIPSGLTESVLFGHERGAFTGAVAASKGYFEEADGGTLVLDEIGELSPHAQAALLRVLETKTVRRIGGQKDVPVDVRIVAATHRDLDARVASGDFRADLLFRLNTVTLFLPPLRSRKEEIQPLGRHFIRQANESWGGNVTGLAVEAVAALEAYSWPGNIRELRNTIERAIAMCEETTIGLADLPERMRRNDVVTRDARGEGSEYPPAEASQDARPFRDRLREFEKGLILDALCRAGGNQSRAATLLGMPLRTLVHKIGTYGIRKRSNHPFEASADDVDDPL